MQAPAYVRAVGSVSRPHYLPGTYAPFLYFTPTIQQRSIRGQAERNDHAREDGHAWNTMLRRMDKIHTSQKQRRARESGNAPAQPTYASVDKPFSSDPIGNGDVTPPSMMRRPAFERRTPRDARYGDGPASSGSVPDKPTQKDRPLYKTWSGAVPFELSERPTNNFEFPKGVDANGTTVSPAEYRMFQELIGLKKQESTLQEKPQDASQTHKGSLQDRLSQAIHVEVTTEPDKLGGRAAEVPLTPTQQKYEGEINRVLALFRDATDDLKMWTIFQEEAVKPVKALNLDAKRRTPVAKLDHAKQDELKRLSYTFPRHCNNFQRTLWTDFPHSHFAVALLPSLKQLGPATCALGASVDVYNTHLRLLYHKYLDLSQILAYLNEMQYGGIGFTGVTLELVNWIIGRHKLARSGSIMAEPSERAFWTTSRMTECVEAFRVWRPRIQEAIKEQALNAVTSQQNEEEHISAP